MADAPKLVDMAYTKKELKEEQQEARLGEPSPYPWGLCIRLESDELEKLGIAQLPGVGDEMHILAVATVTGVNQSARSGQDDEKSVALQITQMQVLLTESAVQEKAEGKETPAKEASESKSVMAKYKG